MKRDRIEDISEQKGVSWGALEDNPALIFLNIIRVHRDCALENWELIMVSWGFDLLEFALKRAPILNLELKTVFFVLLKVLNDILDENKDEKCVNLCFEMSPLEQSNVIIRCNPTLLFEKLSFIINIE